MRRHALTSLISLCLLAAYGCGSDGSTSGPDAGGSTDRPDAGDSSSPPDAGGDPTACAPLGDLDRLSDITEDTVLAAADGCVVVEGTVTVTANLTIEPGITLYFEQDAGLDVAGGSLDARGSADAPILFTATDEVPGYWSGIQYIDTRSSDNALEHVVIEYAGGQAFDGAASAALVLNSTGITGAPVRVAIDDVTVRHSAALGMYVEEDAEIDSFSSNTFTDNEGAPVMVPATLIGALDGGSSYAGNDDDVVRVQGNTEDAIADGDHRWSALDVPYRVDMPLIEIASGGHVDIDPGVTMTFTADSGLDVQGGTLSAVGDETNPITFAGSEDLQAFWQGIQFIGTRSADNRLEHVIITGAASDSFDGAGAGALVLNSSGITGSPVDVALDAVAIEDFGGEAAVYVETDTTLTACSSLTGFGAGDVTGSGAGDFSSECGL